jgi:hypothetical protein
MDNRNFVTKNTQPNMVESTEKSDILTEKCSAMKAEIEDEAQQIFEGHQGNVSKPKTLTEACTMMKAESKDEAKRLVPDRGNQH